MGAFAQTSVLWSEDFSSFEDGAVPAGGTYNYVCENGGGTTKVYGSEKIAGGTAPELLVAKSNGSFSATVPMNGVTGDVNLVFKANRTLSVEVNGTAVETTAAGNDYSCVVNVAAGKSNVTIKFTNTQKSNARLDNIKFFTGVAKKPAGISWGTSARTVTIGSDDNLFPTLTNTYNLPITYTSSEPTVATIAADGTVTLVAEGKTDISASFAGNDDYEAATVVYTLTVKAAADPSESIENTPETAYTVAKAFELITAGKGLDSKVYVKGIISEIKEVSTNFGNATYYISDDGTTASQLYVYRGYGLDGEKFTSDTDIKTGDNVIVYGKLVNYNNTTPEVATGSQIYSLNGVTGINSATVANSTLDVNAPIYNLAGQRVSSDFKGIAIQNGKKFVK